MADLSNSQAGNVSDAVAQIATLASVADVEAFIDGDDRQGVRKAAEERIAELSQPGVVGGGDSRSKPGSPLSREGGDKLVRTRFPVDSFEHGITGLGPITAHGVKVPSAKLAELLEKAAASRVELEEVDD